MRTRTRLAEIPPSLATIYSVASQTCRAHVMTTITQMSTANNHAQIRLRKASHHVEDGM